MDGEEHVDSSFLEEFTGFLDQCNVPDDAVEEKSRESSATGDDGLLLASHQLLAETEELLASYTSPVDNQQQIDVNSPLPSAKSSEEDKQETSQNGKMLAEKRREIRNAQAAKRRLRYRQKLKDEKEMLTQQANELTVQLTELQTAEAEMKAKQLRSLRLGAWKAIALRQLERRVQAEQQRKMLRAEVVGRSRLIHEMNLVLQERLQSNQENIISCEMLETDGALLFKTMLSEVDDLYLQTDRKMCGLKFKSSSVPVAYTLTKKWDKGVLYFDSADMIEFPYDFEQASDAVSAMLMSDGEDNFEMVNVSEIKDILTVKYSLKYKLREGETAEFVIYGVAKRYREKNRLVHVWRSLTEGQGEFDGLQSDETAWMVVRPSLENCKAASGKTSTILESYSRMVPVGFGNMSASDEDVDRFVEILTESGEQEVKQMVKIMEKLMISGP